MHVYDRAMSHDSLEARVEQVLDTIRPMLHFDGGDVTLVEVDEEGFVYLQLHGACEGCPVSQTTLSRGIEAELHRVLGEDIAGVINATAG